MGCAALFDNIHAMRAMIVKHMLDSLKKQIASTVNLMDCALVLKTALTLLQRHLTASAMFYPSWIYRRGEAA